MSHILIHKIMHCC